MRQAHPVHKRWHPNKVGKNAATHSWTLQQKSPNLFLHFNHTAGAVTKKEVNDLKTNHVRKYLFLLNNVRSVAIRNFIQDFSQPIADV